MHYTTMLYAARRTEMEEVLGWTLYYLDPDSPVLPCQVSQSDLRNDKFMGINMQPVGRYLLFICYVIF